MGCISVKVIILLLYHFAIFPISALDFDDSDVFEDVMLRIPWPSGIIITPITDSTGRSFKMGIVQHSVIQIRPEWSQAHIIRGLFNEVELKLIVDKAEEYARRHGWPERRHIDFDIRPTNDLTLPMFLAEAEWTHVVHRITSVMFPAMADKFGLNASDLFIDDLFLTKYESSRTDRNYLGEHTDKSPWSFVLTLNDDFEGGGTYFSDLSEVWRPPPGDLLIFSGTRLHAGRGGAYLYEISCYLSVCVVSVRAANFER